MKAVCLTNKDTINVANIAYVTEPFGTMIIDMKVYKFKIVFNGGNEYKVGLRNEFQINTNCFCFTEEEVDKNYALLISALEEVTPDVRCKTV